MTIELPEELESSVRSLVEAGRFASLDEAMAEAARLLLRQQRFDKKSLTEEEFKQELLEAGLMTSLPTPLDPALRKEFQPVKIEGEPLSETIIRERR